MRHRDNQNEKSNRGEHCALLRGSDDNIVAQYSGSGLEIMIEEQGLCFPSRISHLAFYRLLLSGAICHTIVENGLIAMHW